MPVPDQEVFSLGDATSEIGGGINSLGQCFANANVQGFIRQYAGLKDRLGNFRGYDHTISSVSADYGYSSVDGGAACDDWNDSPGTRVTLYSNASFTTATQFSSNLGGRGYVQAGYYSDGFNYRFWNGSIFKSGTTGTCIF